MELLEIEMEGWTATPRMPFILSGNAICMPTPSYSLLLGLIGCCLGRMVLHSEVRIGFEYSHDGVVAKDIETRQRLENNRGRIKAHAKGSDAYSREFHVNPRLKLWMDRTDWAEYFRSPVGTPSLGRSQDILSVKSVRTVTAKKAKQGRVHGTMVPFTKGLLIPGQLVQIAEAFRENESVNTGRSPTASRIFISIPFDSNSEIEFDDLYTVDDSVIYLHRWQ